MANHKVSESERRKIRSITLSDIEISEIKSITENRSLSGGIRDLIKIANEKKAGQELIKKVADKRKMKKFQEIAAEKLPKKSDL